MRKAPTPQQRGFPEQQAHASTESLRRQLGTIPFLDGVAAQRITIAASGSKVITHNLKRTPVGWIVTRVTGSPAELHETARDRTTLTLEHEGAAETVIDVWIF